MDTQQHKKKVYVTREVPEPAYSMLLEKGYDVTVGKRDRPPTKKEIIKALRKGSYDAVLSLLTDTIDADVFDAAPQVKIFANYAIGFDNINLEEAKRRRVYVSNTPGNYNNTIAEHTIGMMLALSARITEGDRFVRAGKYRGWSPMLLIGTLLEGKTLGIVGAGRIGQEVAKRAHKGFGMRVIYHDMMPSEALENECQAIRVATIEELLSQSDVVSLHVPLLPETRHLIDAERLKRMKKTAYLINTARGPVIDEKALLFALKDEVIAGAALDVYEFEPKLTRGLARLKNIVLTPHTASSTIEARREMAEIAAKNIIAVLEGGEPITPVYKA